jgi:hypothetical protein
VLDKLALITAAAGPEVSSYEDGTKPRSMARNESTPDRSAGIFAAEQAPLAGYLNRCPPDPNGYQDRAGWGG